MEEAAEIVLGGPLWHICHICGGIGSVRKMVLRPGDMACLAENGTVYSVKPCAACDGAGGHISKRSQRAYERLNLPMPSASVHLPPPPKGIGVIKEVEAGECVVEMCQEDRAFGFRECRVYRMRT